MLFKKANKNDEEPNGCMHVFWTIIDWPLNLVRDLTIPAGDREKWNRTKMAFVPVFLPMSLLYLFGLVEDTESFTFWLGLIGTIPGIFFGLYIGFCTKKTGPPEWLMTTSAIMCFVMSIGWINFTSDLVVDTIGLAGRIVDLP